jgi:hypothetical protein
MFNSVQLIHVTAQLPQHSTDKQGTRNIFVPATAVMPLCTNTDTTRDPATW